MEGEMMMVRRDQRKEKMGERDGVMMVEVE
ncbi:uncharacterized protein G2W53_040881 [Senna tora]|uniref:Uncharacterized protein n=1 Tax=Senna tora TaxID=362788 RepID=A0A834VYT5_9FABA|nr:uncharacterized protein G2W53_040881 [Senna tora]